MEAKRNVRESRQKNSANVGYCLGIDCFPPLALLRHN